MWQYAVSTVQYYKYNINVKHVPKLHVFNLKQWARVHTSNWMRTIMSKYEYIRRMSQTEISPDIWCCICTTRATDQLYKLWIYNSLCFDSGLVLAYRGLCTVASFTKEFNQQLAKHPLKINGNLANQGLTSLVRETTGKSVTRILPIVQWAYKPGEEAAYALSVSASAFIVNLTCEWLIFTDLHTGPCIPHALTP